MAFVQGVEGGICPRVRKVAFVQRWKLSRVGRWYMSKGWKVVFVQGVEGGVRELGVTPWARNWETAIWFEMLETFLISGN